MTTRAPWHRLPRLVRDDDGNVTAIVAVTFVALAGIASLSFDFGRLLNLDTEMQSAVDAAALAGATQLDNELGARDRARQAAITSANALAVNGQVFSTDDNGTLVTIRTENIRFLIDLETRDEATTDAEANFIEIDADQRRVDYAFGGLVGNVSADTGGHAVAGMTTAFCQVPPLMICAPPNDFNPSDPDEIFLPGQGIQLKESNGGGWVPGNFGLLALNQPDGSVDLSADLIRDALGRVDPVAQCFNTDGTVTTKPGQTTSVAMGINMRFDIYPQGNLGGPPYPDEPSKFEDNPHYMPSMNPTKGLVRNGSECSFEHPNGWNHPAERYDGPGDTAVDAMGFPRDNCAYPSGGNGCNPNAGGSQFGDTVWDVDKYMEVNHPGIAWPTEFGGYPGIFADANNPTRYEVYQWELVPDANVPPNYPNMPGGANTAEAPYIGPQCNTTAVQANPDRRVISAALIDCTGLTGTETVEDFTFIQLLLTEPMGVYDGNNDIYVEYIGLADEGGPTASVARHIVQLYE